LVGDGPVKTVVGHKVSNLEGLTPLVAVLSAGTLRERVTFLADKPTFRLDLQVWVRQATGDDWTDAMAMDALDAIEALIAGVVEDNRGNATWEILEYAGTTSVVEWPIGGVAYYMEYVPLAVKLVKS